MTTLHRILTTIYCVTKQPIDNRKFIHEPTAIALHKLSCKPWNKHSADRKWKIIDENNSFCFEKPINGKITDCLLINLTRAPGKRLERLSPPSRKLPPSGPLLLSEFPLPSEGGGGYGYLYWLLTAPQAVPDADWWSDFFSFSFLVISFINSAVRMLTKK